MQPARMGVLPVSHMTYFDDSLDFAPVTEQNSDPILPEDRFVFELIGMEKSEPDEWRKNGGVKWTFLVSYPDGRPFIFNDKQYEFWRNTGLNAKGQPVMTAGTNAHEWASALLGRELAVDETLKVRELRGKKMQAMVVWERQRNNPNKKSVKLASLKHVPATSSATPQSNVNVDGLRDLLRKKVRQAEVLQSPQHLTWLSLNIDTMDADDCNEFIRTVQADLDAA